MLLQPSVSGVAVSACVSYRAHGRHFFLKRWIWIQCVKLMLSNFFFAFVFLLRFDCFVYRKNVTCLKRFTRYGHYAG